MTTTPPPPSESVEILVQNSPQDEVAEQSLQSFSPQQLEAITWIEQNTFQWISKPIMGRMIGLVKKLRTNPQDPLMIDDTKILEEAFYVAKMVALELIEKFAERDPQVGLGHQQWNVFSGMFERLFKEGEEQWDPQRQVLGRLLNRHLEAWSHYVVTSIDKTSQVELLSAEAGAAVEHVVKIEPIEA